MIRKNKAAILVSVIALAMMSSYAGYKQGKVDKQAPVLSVDEETIEVVIGASDEELLAGVTAKDNRDGDVSDSIVIESIEKNEDSKENSFLITYVAFDSSGNFGHLSRELIYTDYEPTHFSFTQALRFAENQSFTLFDYIRAEDCIDGDLSAFITLDGGDNLLGQSINSGLYDCTLSVTNSVGDTTELPVQVEVYEDSYEERVLKPQINLKEYLVYIKKGDSFDAEEYLDYIVDGGNYRIDYGPMVTVQNGTQTETVTEKVAQGDTGDWINISEVMVESQVNTEKTGIYNVIYRYISERNGYECTVQMIVVVE